MIVFALVSLLAFLIDLGIFVALHVLPTGYSPISHAVSDYAVGKYKSLFRVRLWVNALGILALVAALASASRVQIATLDLLFLGLVALTRVAMSFFPTDLEGKKLTRTGLLHYLCAILSFAFAFTALRDMTPALQHAFPWASGTFGFLYVLVLPALIAVIVTLVPMLRRIFGLFERIFLLTILFWLLLVSVALVGIK